MSLYKNISFFIYIQNKRTETNSVLKGFLTQLPEFVLLLKSCITGLLQGPILV